MCPVRDSLIILALRCLTARKVRLALTARQVEWLPSRKCAQNLGRAAAYSAASNRPGGNDEHERIGRSEPTPHGSRPPDRAGRRVLGHHGAELFAFPQRHDAIAGAGAVPDVEERIRAQLCADRGDQPGDAGDLVAAATGGRAVLGPPAATLFAFRRDGRDPDRSAAAGERRQLLDPDAGGCAGRHRLGGLSPGSLARRPLGLGRTARPGAILVPGRRQHWLFAGADPGRLYRDPEGPVEDRKSTRLN